MRPYLILPLERVERTIFVLRGQKVILDADLAKLYGVTTKRLNEQVKRNRERFPEDFMFQLTPEERSEVVANCDHFSKLKFSPVLPYAFTEHGAIVEWVAVPGVEDYSILYIQGRDQTGFSGYSTWDRIYG